MKPFMGRQSGQDLGYFVRVASLSPRVAEAPPDRVAGAPPDRVAGAPPAARIRLVRGSGPKFARTMAILYALGGIVGGPAVFFGLMLLFAFFSMLGGGDRSGDVVFAAVCGSVVTVGGIVMGVIILRDWRHDPAIDVTPTAASVTYPGFKHPLVVSRDLVRVVAIDDRPTQWFHNNKRFPVVGALPDDAFADALDQHHRPPWEPRDHPHPTGTTGPTVPSDSWPRGANALPGIDGDAHLFGHGGTALHVLRVNAEDVPNVAVIFHRPLKTPRAPLGFQIGARCGFFLGGRTIRGFMARVESPELAAAAFDPWGVVRQVSAADVLDEGLRVPKPLRGWRVAAYAALIIIPFVLRLILRSVL